MGLRDLPVWGGIAMMFANMGMDKLGEKTCAKKGHKWHDVGAIVLKNDGGIEELERGAMQRCVRCGATRKNVTA